MLALDQALDSGATFAAASLGLFLFVHFLFLAPRNVDDGSDVDEATHVLNLFRENLPNKRIDMKLT